MWNIKREGLLDIAESDHAFVSPEVRKFYDLREGDIVIANSSGNTGLVGRSALWPRQSEPWVFDSGVMRFRSSAVVPLFALAVFRYWKDGEAFAGGAHAGRGRSLGISRLRKLAFPVPPPDEQSRIAAILDDALQGTASQRAALESRLEALRAQRRDVLTNLATDSRFPTKTLGELGELSVGIGLTPERSQSGSGTPYVRAGNIGSQGDLIGELLRMDIRPQEAGRYAVRVGDVLLAEGSGSRTRVGRALLWSPALQDAFPSVAFQNSVIRFRSSKVDPRYAVLVFRALAETGGFAAVARGSGIQHLSATRLSTVRIAVPPIGDQTRVAAAMNRRLEALRTESAQLEESLAALDDDERNLIARAMRGGLGMSGPAVGRGYQPAPATSPSGRSAKLPSGRGRQPGARVKAPLVETARRAGRSIAMLELYRLAGYDRDDTSDVEAFYVEIRDALTSGSLRLRDDDENTAVVVR
ncbi:MAG TPA: hypothetical protein VGX96_16305 [Candidatus Elarobacter sp.]|nr:hypothetical protein [Candidatus Elarobacter sp.]